MKDVSVIIPCYNRVELLRQTLKSVANAINDVDAEIILVDDGSEPSIEMQLGDIRHLNLAFKFIRHNNSGLVYSKYAGLMEAAGKYIQFLDSDDQIAPDKLRLQVAAMDLESSDVSYTDVMIAEISETGEIKSQREEKIASAHEPYNFYLNVQPAPHSPIYRKSYLIEHLTNPFIPLSRQFDAIGEVWLYYNLCIFNAVITKVNAPLTIVINHTENRITNHWENLGFAALAIQKAFVSNVPEAMYTTQAKHQVSILAFNTFRGLPYNINFKFQRGFIAVWRQLGSQLDERSGGRVFKFFSTFLGPLFAAIVMKALTRKNYHNIKTLETDEFNSKLKALYNQLH